MTRENSAIGQAWRSHSVGRSDSAVAEFKKLVDMSPEDPDTLYGFGMAQRGAGQLDEAVATFTRVLELLAKITPESDDQRNRLEMLTRMTNQQIVMAGGTK
jgi:predicted TPR repeat methyltransferase